MDPIESGLIQMGNDIKAVVAFNGQPQIISLNKSQMIFLRTFFQTGNFNLSVQSAGVEKSTVRNWMKQKKFREFLRERWEFAAKIRGFDLAVWKSHFIDIFLGRAEEEPGKASLKTQIEAGKILGKHFNWLETEDSDGDGRGFEVREKDSPAKLESPQQPAGSIGGPVPLQVSDGGTQIRQDPPNDLPDANASAKAQQQDLVCGPVQEPSGGNCVGGFQIIDTGGDSVPVQRNETPDRVQERKPDSSQGS